MAAESDEVGVAQPLEIAPLPVPVLGRALVEDLVGPADIVVPPLQVGAGDALEVEAPFDPFARLLLYLEAPFDLLARLLFRLLGLLSLVQCLRGPTVLAPQEDRTG